MTLRRWLVLANPLLTELISDAIGEGWKRDLAELSRLTPLADDAGFRIAWQRVKAANKSAQARRLGSELNTPIDAHSLFDVQVKRIHEYKRQHLNILEVIACYLRWRENTGVMQQPRTWIFGGKAAPGYHMAKLMIRLITGVGAMIAKDPAASQLMRVIFVPNFSVTIGQRIYPAADLSEQISTAGKEASGTGNMKFQMSGALTIGTLDGANIEIREAVGADNFFLFGLTADGVQTVLSGGYRPMDYVQRDPELRAVLELIASGHFSGGDTELFRPLVDNLRNSDPFLVLADFRAYANCQQQVATAFADTERWARMSILNAAHSGYFSSDRAIGEYCRDICRAAAVPIRLLTPTQVQSGRTTTAR